MAAAKRKAVRGERSRGYGQTSRTYTLPDGRVFDSVTSINKVLAKPALITWAANTERELVVEASADLYDDCPLGQKMNRVQWISSLEHRLGKTRAHQKALEEAGEIGSKAHAMIEWTIRKELGEVVGPAPELCSASSLAFAEFENWQKESEMEPLMIEQTVWSSRHEYAGTMDLLAKVTDPLTGSVRHALIDWKTGKSIYDDALLQSAAYTEALIEMGHAPSSEVWGLIVRLPKVETDPGFELRWISPSERSRHFKGFLAAKALWDWQDENKRA